jgi:hypothetical protein
VTTYEFFLLCVSTNLSAVPRRSKISTNEVVINVTLVLSEAWTLSPDALKGLDPAIAAREFVGYMIDGRAVPLWLKDWREKQKARMRIRLNRNVDARQWWFAAEGLAEGLPLSCQPIVCDRVESIDVNREDFDAFVSWGESIPGWHEQPFVFEPVEQ